jgi:uncharacterized protein YsxB (DUF464 family)
MFLIKSNLLAFFFMLVVTCLPVSSAPIISQEQKDQQVTDVGKYAVIIGGVSGEETYAKKFAQWSSDLYQVLTEQLKFDPKNIKVLSENPKANAIQSTAEGVERTFENLNREMKPESTLFIFLIGHGSFNANQAKFNLVGPDLSASAFSALVNKLNVRRLVILNMASASGEFIKPLAAPGRVVITATRSGSEQNATRFAEHFISALKSPSVADTDQNKRLSILEVYTYTVKLIEDSYKSSTHLATEHALIDDNGDGIGHHTAEKGEGALARSIYIDSSQSLYVENDWKVRQVLKERERLEEEIGKLISRKDQMPETEYELLLEKLFVELAKLNRNYKNMINKKASR